MIRKINRDTITRRGKWRGYTHLRVCHENKVWV